MKNKPLKRSEPAKASNPDSPSVIRYQYSFNGACSPVRDTWEEAARDAVEAGSAYWDNPHVLVLATEVGAVIRPIREANRC